MREAILNDELYIFTHTNMRGAVEERFARIMAGFDAAEASPALKGVESALPEIVTHLGG